MTKRLVVGLALAWCAADRDARITVENEREADVFCDSDAACSDGVGGTEDYCLISGECAHLPSCTQASDCTGGQTGAWVSCYQQKCYWYCNPAVCPDGDLDSDGRVDAADLAELLTAWGPKDDFWPADLTGDLLVDADDLAALLSNWTREKLPQSPP